MNIYDAILVPSAEKFAFKPALSIRHDLGAFETYTFAEVKEGADRFAQAIAAAGVRAGDRVAILAGNSPQWGFAFFALMRLRACAVLMDCALAVSSLRELMQEADLRAVICSPAFLDASASLSIPALNIHDDLSCFPDRPARLPEGYPETPDPDEEAAVIVFSSGTTSGYKGVVQTHQALYWAAEAGGPGNGVHQEDRLLATIPLSHSYGLMAKLIAPLLCGAVTCYIETNDAKSLLAAFKEFKPTGFCCVPRVFDMFYGKAMEVIDAKGPAASRIVRGLLRLSGFLYRRLGIKLGRMLFKQILDYFGGDCTRFMSGGAPLSPATENFFFGLASPVFNNYALTEGGLPLICNRPSHYHRGTCGNPVAGAQIRIHQPNARGIGEIRIKSPGQMKGYFRNPQATADAFDEDGWLKTGDMGRLTKHGDLIVTGRIKENIILPTGVALSPVDIERQYGVIPGVSQLVVCGIPAGVGAYDEIHAFVLPDARLAHPRQTIEAAIRQKGESVPAAMRISQIHFVTSIPQTTLEKPRRFLLREQLNAEAAAAECKPLPPIAEPVVKAIRSFRLTERAIGPDMRIIEDLGFDSLSVTELCLRLEELTGKDISTQLRPHVTVLELAEALEAAQPGAHPLYGGRYRLEDFPKDRRFSDRVAFLSVKTLFDLAWHFTVTGLENLPKEGNYLLCPNHQTDLDAIFILMQLDRPTRARLCAMAAIEHMDKTLSKHLFCMVGGIPVDRRVNPGPAYTRCKEVLTEGRILLIHPEGTRTRDGNIGVFKEGAARLSIETGLPIIPVRLIGAYEAFPYTQKRPTLTGRPHVRIAFGQPIPPDGTDAEALTEKVRQAMLAL